MNSMINKRKNQFDENNHKLLTIWASDCAEHVLPLFKKIYPDDNRPLYAIEAARAWVRGEIKMVEARKAAFASHAAARDSNNVAAKEVARSAGHAAATAHVANHAIHASVYAIKAVVAAGDERNVASEIKWQYHRLPNHLRLIIFPNSNHKTNK